MRIAILKEKQGGEKRAAIAPDAVKKFVKLGAQVRVEKGAGLESGISDDALKDAGAEILSTAKTALDKADIVLCVQLPEEKTLNIIPENAVLIGMLDPFGVNLELLNLRKQTAFAMELLPRISRAQSMDVLSSQSNLSGYRAVIDAVAAMGKATPMMMTAAGTVPPAKVLVLGAGVAGLQAIATAKRLGAVVTASDVRPEVKEQIESLGGKFLEVEADEAGSGAGGYAKEMSKDYQEKQKALVHETLKTSDICITTALIPGRPAPELITAKMLKDMKAGSVIVDLAVANGGNCKASKPDEVIEKDGVTIIGHTNMPSRVATDATPLYARNLYNFVADLMVDKETKALNINWEDELIKGTLLTKDGETVHAGVLERRGDATPKPVASTDKRTEENADEQ
jgi:NAD(P) transhydrogenase subunit alpha